MKRSEQVSLAFMGVAAFAATFASATLYMAKPGGSAMAKPGGSAVAAAGSSAIAAPGSSAMVTPASSAMVVPASPAMAVPASSAIAKPGASAQSCTTRPDGSQNCELRSSTSSYLIHAGSGSNAAEPKKTQGAALISNANARSSTPASRASIERAGTVRGGFGATGASTSFRASAGG